MVLTSPRKKKSSTRPSKTSSPLHRRKRQLQLHSLQRTAKDLCRADNLKAKRSQARYRLRRVQLHSLRVLLVNRLNKVCPARSLQWGNSLPAVPILSTKVPPQNKHWPRRLRQLCLVHKLIGKAHRWVLIIPAHLSNKVLHPDQLLTRSRKLRSSKGCNLHRDNSKLHTLALISLLRLPRRKCKHRDRHLLRRRNLHLLHQRRRIRPRLRLLSHKDPSLLSLVNRHSHLLRRPQVKPLNKLLHLLNKLLHLLSWLKLRLLLNSHLRHSQLRSLPRHRHRRLLHRHSSKHLQLNPWSLHQLQWLLRYQLHNLRQQSLHRLLQPLHRRQHLWHRRLQQIRTHTVALSDP